MFKFLESHLYYIQRNLSALNKTVLNVLKVYRMFYTIILSVVESLKDVESLQYPREFIH